MAPIHYSNRPHPLLIVVGGVIMTASFVARAAVFSVVSTRATAPDSPPAPLATEQAPETVAQPEGPPAPAGQAG